MSTVPTDDYNVSISSAPSSTAAITIYCTANPSWYVNYISSPFAHVSIV